MTRGAGSDRRAFLDTSNMAPSTTIPNQRVTLQPRRCR